MKKRLILVVTALVLVLSLGAGIYVRDYYRAGNVALAALRSTDTVTVSLSDTRAEFRPGNVKAGLIFYPGGKVEFTAYAPLH